MGLGLGRCLEIWMYIQDIKYIPQGTPAGVIGHAHEVKVYVLGWVATQATVWT